MIAHPQLNFAQNPLRDISFVYGPNVVKYFIRNILGFICWLTAMSQHRRRGNDDQLNSSDYIITARTSPTVHALPLRTAAANCTPMTILHCSA